MSGIRKNSKSQLHPGTKIEARKPLDVPVHTTTTSSSTLPTESLSLNYTKVEWNYTRQ